MMPSPPQGQTPRLVSLQLQDFGQLQQRYQALGLAARATAVLLDAEPALNAAERILGELESNEKIKQAFDNIAKNVVLTGKMRPSEAKNFLMEGGGDFIGEARRKLAAWRKTMERLSQGEGIESDKGREYIPHSAPLALAIAGNTIPSSYLSIVQLAVGELTRLDASEAAGYASIVAEIRRCATLLSDCEHASAIQSVAH